MIQVSAGYFKLTADEPPTAIEGRCKAFAANPPPDDVVHNSDGQDYILRSPEWKETGGVLLATMCRIRDRGLPAKVDEHGQHTPIGARLSEAASFAYRPSRELILIQWNTHGPRHNRAARLLEAAGILRSCDITPEIKTDALTRMQLAPLVRRLEFTLTGLDSDREATLRNSGINGVLDDMKAYGGTSVHVSISLGHMPGQLNEVGVRALVGKLIGVPSGVRAVKVGIKESQEHDVEMLDLMSCRSKLEFDVDEVNYEIDQVKCRDRLLFNIVAR